MVDKNKIPELKPAESPIMTVEDAKAVLQAEKEQKIRQCQVAIQQALKDNDCVMLPRVRTKSGGLFPINDFNNDWSIEISIQALA